MAKVGVVLSGCGVFDGSEIHESVLTLLFLSRAGVEYQCVAPDINQTHVINHVTKEEAVGESRNVLVEAARIARGDIKALASVSADDFDAVIFPGGFGAAKNLSDFAFKGAQCDVNPDVKRLVAEMQAKKKLLAFICISPTIAAKLIPGATVTIGNDDATASAIEACGGNHQSAPIDGVVVDEANNIVTTPAYMYNAPIADVAKGIEKLVETVAGRLG